MAIKNARHHTEWLSLVEVSGPFLSLPVLERVFPQQLDAVPTETRQLLREAYAEWRAAQQGNRPDPRLHDAWLRFVLTDVLNLPDEVLAEDPDALEPLAVTLDMHGVRLCPDRVILDPEPGDIGARARCLIARYPSEQRLNRAVARQTWKATPATRMQALLHATGVPLGLVTNGEHWLLVHARNGETSTFASWYAELWLDEPLTLRAFVSLLGVRRWFGVAAAERLPALFAESGQHQQELTSQLGYQVRRAVEILIRSLDQVDKDRQRELLRGVDDRRLYEAAVTLMMRLVFLLFAEERGLLLRDNPVYDQHYAVSTLRARLREQADQVGEVTLERRHDAWSRLLATFRMIYAGVDYPDLRMPAYGGRLFDPDRFPFLEGRTPGSSWRAGGAETPLPISNRTVLHLLDALQVLTERGGEARLLSFRALGEEQIGQIYEGLLDHAAKRATAPLLGLHGSKNKEPEPALAELEQRHRQGEDTLLAWLKEQTGRSLPALRKALGNADALDHTRLRVACDNDEALLERVRPYAALLREDSSGYPVVITQGSVYVTTGADRRSTGTHYTPPDLTEGLVRHTLEPLVYRDFADGVPASPQTLHTPRELLALKICDPACGSAAFLVQACRYLADQLIEAWQRLEDQHPDRVVIDAEGTLADYRPADCPIPVDIEERRLTARRLVADRCLYGVDKNAMAAEMAKLSLWLTTLQKNRPFTFLDHAIRHGDALLGIADMNELDWFYQDASGQQRLGAAGRERLLEAAQRRIALERIPDTDLDHIETKARLLDEAQVHLEQLRLLADVATGARLESGDKVNRLEETLQQAAMLDEGTLRERARGTLHGQQPFHWPLEYPEVFAGGREGFDAFVGNPPFQGGQRITGALGTDYRDYLVTHIAGGRRGSADLCAYFFLRTASLLRPGGMLGLLATNTIAQGDTREVGLDQLLEHGFSTPRAVASRPWPGDASLEVAHVWLRRGDWQAARVLDDKPVSAITPYLTAPGKVTGNPYRLAANADLSFQGSIVLGLGFVLTPEDAQALIEKNPRNRDALYPYLNGEDLNNQPDQSPSRWVINFHDWPLDRSAEGSWIKSDDKRRKIWLREGGVPADYPDPVAADYPDLLLIVEEKVKPERTRRKNGKFALRYPLYLRWWQYAEKRPLLYSTISGMERVLVTSRVSKFFGVALAQAGWVYNERLTVFAQKHLAIFSLLQNSAHENWMLVYGLTHETRPVYTSTGCFETFPLPEVTTGLADIGDRYYLHRQTIMQTRQEGLTATYNRFHDPEQTAEDIARLRALHVELDQAVAAAYGWDDLDLDHGFHDTRQGLRYTIGPAARQEVLDRLLTLNHERYAEEVKQGLHDKKKGKGKAKTGKTKARTDKPTSTIGVQTTLELPGTQRMLDF